MKKIRKRNDSVPVYIVTASHQDIFDELVGCSPKRAQADLGYLPRYIGRGAGYLMPYPDSLILKHSISDCDQWTVYVI